MNIKEYVKIKNVDGATCYLTLGIYWFQLKQNQLSKKYMGTGEIRTPDPYATGPPSFQLSYSGLLENTWKFSELI